MDDYVKKLKHFVGIRPEHLKAIQSTKFTFNPEIELIENNTVGSNKVSEAKKHNIPIITFEKFKDKYL